MKTLRLSLSIIVFGLLAAAAAFALTLDEAKARGLVGETHTGYLAAVAPSAEVDALVESINTQRRAQYQQIASEHGISLQAVEARAGLKAIEKTPAGQFVNTGSGWQKK